jgi:hypothetical protein
MCAILVEWKIQQGESNVSRKIKIPNFIAEKIDELKRQGLNLYQIFNYNDEVLQEYARNFPEQLMRALVDGYEAKEERLSYRTKDYEIWRTTYENANGEKVPVFRIKIKPFGIFTHYATIHSQHDRKAYEKMYRDLQYLPPKE